MSSKFEDKFYSIGQKVTLSFDEREALRAKLLAQIDRSSKPTVSPYSPLFYWRHISVYIKPQYVSIALLFILVSGAISVAAEKALPGEPLYQVKTSVNENVLALFALTPQSKAQLHLELAVRRLEEVESLAIAGKLDATTTANAESDINDNLDVIKNSVKQLVNENNDTAAADTSSKAESSLKVHEAILGTISDGSDSVNASVKNMAISVGIQTTSLSLDRAAIDSKISSTTPSLDVLLDQEKSAEDAIAVIQAALSTSTASSSLSTITPTLPTKNVTEASTTASSTANLLNQDVQDKLQAASDFLAKGTDKLNVKSYGEAFVFFKKAQKSALEGQLLLQSSLSPDVADDTVSIDISNPAVENATSTATSTSATATSSPSV